MEKKHKSCTGATRKRETDMFRLACLMLVTTLIAGWHITCVWSGIVTLICGVVTLWFVREEVKAYEEIKSLSGRKRKCKAV